MPLTDSPIVSKGEEEKGGGDDDDDDDDESTDSLRRSGEFKSDWTFEGGERREETNGFGDPETKESRRLSACF